MLYCIHIFQTKTKNESFADKGEWPGLKPPGVEEQKCFIPQMTSKILKIREKPDLEPPGVVEHPLEPLVQYPPNLQAQVCLVNRFWVEGVCTKAPL